MELKIYSDLYFSTATILHWYPLLARDDFKDIIINAFKYIVEKKKATIWAFVLMDTHIHLVWQILDPYSLTSVNLTLLRYTSKRFIAQLKEEKNDYILELFRVNKVDRKYQIWKRNSLNVAIYSDKVLNQKINYIHNNLAKKGLNDVKYAYSTASYYETGIKNWDFLL